MIKLTNYNNFLEKFSESLDIPPSKYKLAIDRYTAIGNHLQNIESEKNLPVSIYVQGSFRLGTVTKPLRDSDTAEYDIDLVCEIDTTKSSYTAREIKHIVREKLEAHKTYSSMLDKEGKRCWTINYADEGNISFHIDVLPSIPESKLLSSTAIAITHKHSDLNYSWNSSDPKGYAKWFDGMNAAAFILVESKQRTLIFSENRNVFDSKDEVPNQLIKTPLQKTIQILKRHRDIHFHNAAAFIPSNHLA